MKSSTKNFLALSFLLLPLHSSHHHSAMVLADVLESNRDAIILEDCEGHPMDGINYVRAPDGSCMTAEGLMGVWGCRHEESSSVEHTVCLPSIGGSVIGRVGDTCGCCGECGEAIALCPCPCDRYDGGVLLEEKLLWGITMKRCHPPGIAEALVREDKRFSCYENCGLLT